MDAANAPDQQAAVFPSTAPADHNWDPLADELVPPSSMLGPFVEAVQCGAALCPTSSPNEADLWALLAEGDGAWDGGGDAGS